MIERSEAEVLEFLGGLWKYYDDLVYNGSKVERVEQPVFDIKKVTDARGAGWNIGVSMMYEAPQLTFEILKKLANFFGTDRINDDDRFSMDGCETCDYGSEYGYTLTVRPSLLEGNGSGKESV